MYFKKAVIKLKNKKYTIYKNKHISLGANNNTNQIIIVFSRIIKIYL